MDNWSYRERITLDYLISMGIFYELARMILLEHRRANWRRVRNAVIAAAGLAVIVQRFQELDGEPYAAVRWPAFHRRTLLRRFLERARWVHSSDYLDLNDSD